MSQYYYTVAALPALRFEDPPVYDRARVLEQCEVEVAPADIAAILAAKLWPSEADTTAAKSVLARYYELVFDLQRYMAAARAAKLGWDAGELPRASGVEPSLADMARGLVIDDEPARAEQSLLRYLWTVLEDLEVGHYFDLNILILYHLRLQLVERRVTIANLEAGQAEFRRQYNTVAESLLEHAR